MEVDFARNGNHGEEFLCFLSKTLDWSYLVFIFMILRLMRFRKNLEFLLNQLIGIFILCAITVQNKEPAELQNPFSIQDKSNTHIAAAFCAFLWKYLLSTCCSNTNTNDTNILGCRFSGSLYDFILPR